jgi:hypothetical protein
MNLLPICNAAPHAVVAVIQTKDLQSKTSAMQIKKPPGKTRGLFLYNPARVYGKALVPAGFSPFYFFYPGPPTSFPAGWYACREFFGGLVDLSAVPQSTSETRSRKLPVTTRRMPKSL